jgi:large subunit ribosomal protein L15
MSLYLHTIKSSNKKNKKPRVGRGGKRGTYSGRGGKGQTARSGGTSHLKRKGMRQLMEQTHKLRGFKSYRPKTSIVEISKLGKYFKDGDQITPEILKDKKIIRNINHGVKILGKSELKIKLEIKGCAVSQGAKEAVEKAGGKIIT